MSERSQVILYIVMATFVIVVFIAVLLIQRHGHKPETKAILDAIEGGRQQQSAEHSAMQYEQKAQGTVLRRILDRFGFIK